MGTQVGWDVINTHQCEVSQDGDTRWLGCDL